MGNNEFSLKEVVASVLSLAIVGFTLWIMGAIFYGGGTVAGVGEVAADIAKRHSSILQAAIGLAGAVTGYYFGRLPAEKAAQAAQQQASSAQTALVGAAGSAATSAATAAQANSDKARVLNQIADLKGQVDGSTPTGGGASILSEGAMRTHVVNRLDQILRGM